MIPERQADTPEGAAIPEQALSALEAEINKAKAMLEAETEERAELAAALASLEEALKRANGRLKLILKSVKRAKSGD